MKVINEKYDPAVPVEKLHQDPDNARESDVGAIFQSIEANGFFGAIVAQKNSGKIVIGNHRFAAAMEAGAETIPVIWISPESAAALRKISIADNATSDLASWNEPKLVAQLEELVRTVGISGSGFDDEDVDRLLKKLNDTAIEETKHFHVLVKCETESERQELLKELERKGFECRGC